MTEKHKKTLSDRQLKALPYFAGCSTFEDGCRQAGVSKHAFYTWLRDPLFKQELDAMREAITTEAVQKLKANMMKATDTLVSLLNRNEQPSLLRTVANDIIGYVLKFKELEDVERRMDKLEEKINVSLKRS